MTNNAPDFQDNIAPRCVLIVEDDSTDMMLITQRLKNIWPTTKILTASSLEDSYIISQTQKQPIDMVFLDLNLPDGFGASTVQEYRHRNSGVRVVIVVTGLDNPSLTAQAKNYGATAVINKLRIMDDDFSDMLMHATYNIPAVSWAT